MSIDLNFVFCTKKTAFFHGGIGQTMYLTPDKFLIAFPEDSHKNRGMVDEPRSIVKAVFKVRLYFPLMLIFFANSFILYVYKLHEIAPQVCRLLNTTLTNVPDEL